MIENVERLVDVNGIGTEFPQELHMVGSTCLLPMWRNCSWGLGQQGLPKVVGKLTYAVLPALLVSLLVSKHLGKRSQQVRRGHRFPRQQLKNVLWALVLFPAFVFIQKSRS